METRGQPGVNLHRFTMESRKMSSESRNAVQLAMRSRERYEDTSTCRLWLSCAKMSWPPLLFCPPSSRAVADSARKSKCARIQGLTLVHFPSST